MELLMIIILHTIGGFFLGVWYQITRTRNQIKQWVNPKSNESHLYTVAVKLPKDYEPKECPIWAHPKALPLNEIQKGHCYLYNFNFEDSKPDRYIKVMIEYFEPNPKFGGPKAVGTYQWIDQDGKPGNYVLGWSGGDWKFLPLDCGVEYNDYYDYRLDDKK